MLAGLRVLVVEDELFVAMELERLVADAGGIVVGPSGDLDAALNLAAGDVDAAVLDVKLDHVTSAPIATALSARHIPYLLITGYEATAVPPDLQGAPRLTKPYGDRDFYAAVKTHLLPALGR